MSLFKNTNEVLHRQTSIAASVPNQSGGGSEPSSFNLVPTEYVLSVVTSATPPNVIFIADDYYQLAVVREAHSVVSTSGTLQLEKLTGTQAPGAGAALLSGTINTASTINTVVSGSLVTNLATLSLNPGDRIAIISGGTQTGLIGVLTLALKRVQ